MSILGGITGSFLNPVNFGLLAAGPAGWAALATRTLGAAIVKEVIGQLGQQLGLPPAITSMAQNAFSAATGTTGGPANIGEAVAQLAQDFGLSPSQQGELTRAAQNDQREMFDKLADAFKSGKEMAESKKSRGSKAGASWLQVIADSMAQALDKKVEDMDKMAKALDKQGSNKSVSASTDLQVAGQEFSYLMNASSTVIKTIGEGLSGMARKQ
ncbi:hypothetical protein [Allosphingosinicella deserti]|uniref:Uncharacterized protein n=1 Tax=Allosphingosinicella deserti TaxID=2116704 RepID=A0A2P7QZV4_9SPHN|nr:hypothetical protein [Sphingomonas deserti]PSJ43485.1 hypothetical protein C7I55_03785 [Sphingomonas deserti]